jgi:hypothetical protein
LNTLSNSLSIGEGERRHRLTEHRKLKKVVSAIDDVQQNERELKRKDDAWAELSKKEKKEVSDDKQRGGSKKDELDRKDKEDNSKSTSKKESKSKEDDSKEDNKDKKKDKDKKNGTDQYYESLTKKEKKEYNKHGWKGDRHDDDEYEICICEDDEHHHRFLDVDTEWSDVDEEESSDAEWSYDESWVDSFELEQPQQPQHSMGRSLSNLFGVFGSNPTDESIAAGSMTTFAAKRSPNKGADQKKSKDWEYDGHNDEKVYKERGSKSSKSGRIKKSKNKGGKSLKKPPKGSKKSNGSSKSKGPSGSDKHSSKSKKLKSTKSSKPCKCRPTQKPHKTKRPTQKPHKTKRPTRRPSVVTEKPVPNIAPKPTTEKPARTMRPTDKPVRTSRPSL